MFLILGRKLTTVLSVSHRCPLSGVREFPTFLHFLRIFIRNRCWIWSNAFLCLLALAAGNSGFSYKHHSIVGMGLSSRGALSIRSFAVGVVIVAVVIPIIAQARGLNNL